MDASVHHPRLSQRASRLPFLVAPFALALVGCGADSGAIPAASLANVSGPAPERALPAPADLPDCSRIAAAAGAFLEGWTLDGESGPWGSTAERKHGVSCTWLSPRAQSKNPFEAIQAASFGVMVTADLDTQSESEVRSIGWAVDDPAVQALGGHLVFPSGRINFSGQLSAVGPQVVIGNVSVGLAQMGAMLVNEIEEGQPMTNRRAVDVALAVQELVRPD
ncbi:hypothetical protein [Luteimonas sp. MC1572]|uniref:hypothetical protein n=1 Tax=Luteimonas sp. MC1572 TaxID=2799325 RepID=UPI0018F0BED9|nr:hypothetical protein [Luteimonas sp. MC1572]MBJ6980909.1 hypothetical protein [Luteimonas sp. MC1572]QQO02265.1 hypothetical protein JGR64_08550 [Luteimonas sp. MC1572]